MLNQLLDRGRAHGRFRLELFEAFYCPDRKRDIIIRPERGPIDVQEFDNLLTNAGGALMEDLLMGAGGTVFSNANSYIGVGDSTTAVSAAHTDLQAATNKLRVAMDATFPSRSGQQITWRSTYSTSQANWTWNEMAPFNASSGGTMFARALVGSPFTKTSALSVVASYLWSVS